MRQFLYAFCVAIAILASTPASAQALQAHNRAFPPDHCSATAPFMAFTGVDGSNTFCDSGQDVLTNAIPACTNGQIVAYEGSKFICKDNNNVPTCQPGTFLSFDGTNYTCNGTGVATCGANQVLTFNGTSYFCVNKDATIPICTANQFLTYNGSYQCAAVQTPAALNVSCPAGQVLSGFTNGAAVCMDIPGNASCKINHYTMPGGALGDQHLTGHYDSYLDGSDYQIEGSFDYVPGIHLDSTEVIPNNTEISNDPNRIHDGHTHACAKSEACVTCVNGHWVGNGFVYPEPYVTQQGSQD